MRIASWQFDLDYLAAKITEQTACVRAGDMAADVDAGKSFERSGNHGLIYVRFVLSTSFREHWNSGLEGVIPSRYPHGLPCFTE